MAEGAELPDPPDLTATVFEQVEAKAKLPLRSMVVLGILARSEERRVGKEC